MIDKICLRYDRSGEGSLILLQYGHTGSAS